MQAAIATVLGALPEIRELAATMAGLVDFDRTRAESLEDYAEAAAEAHARYQAATAPPEDIVALNETAMRLREVLRSDATALATRDLLDRAPFKTFQGLTGYRNVGFELIGWASVMRQAWPQISGKTALTSEELANAKAVGERLVRAAGLRDQAPSTVAEVARIRQQAMTLLLKSYEEVRRAVTYLRWHRFDADTICPTVYGTRNRKGAGSEQPNPAEPGANTTPGTGTEPDPAHGTPPATAGQHPVPQGVPGAAPFTPN